MIKKLAALNIILLLLCNSPCLAQSNSQPSKITQIKTKSKKKKIKYPGSHPDIDRIGERNVGKGINFYSLEKEIILGKKIAQDVERGTKIVDDPIISEYVNRIGQNLVRNSDARVPFTIKVIDGNEINAFALPGGFFFVYSGLIVFAENEAELAGVMAHEIAHVTARHGTRQATRAQITNLASLPLIFLGGWAGYGIRQAAGFLIPLTFLKFSRGFEKEADELGTQYLYKAGYDPTAISNFFERLESLKKKKDSRLSKIFSSHPPNEKRMKFIQKLLSCEEVFPSKPAYVITTSEFEKVKARIKFLANISKRNKKPDNRPTLRKRGTGKIEVPGKEGKQKKDEDERPKLKRRP